jgi:Protein of unknown function (DUF2905)
MRPMRDLSRLLIMVGAALILIGVAIPLLERIGLGRLPGDIMFRRGSFRLYFPLATSILLSLALSLLLWLFRR